MDALAELKRIERLSDERERVRALAALLDKTQRTECEVRSARDATIRKLKESGTRVVDLVALTGLTRARINQIIDHRR